MCLVCIAVIWYLFHWLAVRMMYSDVKLNVVSLNTMNLTNPGEPSMKVRKKKQGKQSRTFQKSWFDHHRWLTYCTTRNRVFCFYCHKVKLQGGLTFREHEKSQCHREACMKYEASNKPSVVVLADRALNKEQDTRRTMLLKQLSSLRFLMRQGLAVWGHSDIEGNLHQIMRCRAEDIPKFHQWLEAGKYQSPEIVNEQIQLPLNF